MAIVRIEVYRRLEATAPHKEYRTKAVEAYNRKNNTNYRNAYELMHKLTEAGKTCVDIGEILYVSKTCVRTSLVKMGIDRIPSGGRKGPLKKLTYKGITQTIAEWAKEIGVTPDCLRGRLRICGWSIEKALTTEPKERNNQWIKQTM